MAVHYGLTGYLPCIESDIEPMDVRVPGKQILASRLEKPLDRSLLRFIEVEVSLGMPEGYHQGVQWCDGEPVTDHDSKGVRFDNPLLW